MAPVLWLPLFTLLTFIFVLTKSLLYFCVLKSPKFSLDLKPSNRLTSWLW